MTAFDEPTKPEEVPAPTADRALLSAFAEAYVATHTHAESLAFLRATAHILADRDEKASVVVRLRKRDRELAQADAIANRQAVALFRQMLEGCVARLMPSPMPGDADI